MAKRYRKDHMPPCPDPAIYIAVKYHDGWGWRKKRGTDTPIKLNESFLQNSNNTSLSSPAATRIKKKLFSSKEYLETGRFVARMGSKLRKCYNETGIMDYRYAYGFEVQKKYPLNSLLKTYFDLSFQNDMARITLKLNSWSVKAQNVLATQYFFELIMLYGEPMEENSLRVETDVSKLFNFDEEFEEEVVLSLLLPEMLPWMLLLKVSCMEGKEPGIHCKHRALRVIGTGRGKMVQQEKKRL